MDGGEIISLVCVLSPLSAPHTLSFPVTGAGARTEFRLLFAFCQNIMKILTNVLPIVSVPANRKLS